MTNGCDILLENGSLILLEDGTSALLLETCVPIVPTPPVVLTGGGAGRPYHPYVSPLIPPPRIQVLDFDLRRALVECVAHNVTSKVQLRPQAARAGARAHTVTTESILTVHTAQSRFVLQQAQTAVDDFDQMVRDAVRAYDA